jgi:superoxide dismutase, Fe-Mn family
MQYRLAPLFCRPWTLNGMSARLIESHYEHNYGAAVRRLNALASEIDALDPARAGDSLLRRLQQEKTDALNSALLHELYFASLGGDGRSPPEIIAKAIERDFSSVNRWRDQFAALARALAGGSGWVLLTYVPRSGGLVNETLTENGHSIPGAIPILALDMYEHAYHLEFGANAAAYVAAFMRNIDWTAVQGRYEDALKAPAPRPLFQKEFADIPAVTVEEVQAMLAAGSPVQLIDTRPRHYVTRTNEIVAGAVWRDPERLEEWIGDLSKSEPVVTFCVYGFHIGCQTAGALRAAGFDARYMAGGHFAWKAIDGPVALLHETKRETLR